MDEQLIQERVERWLKDIGLAIDREARTDEYGYMCLHMKVPGRFCVGKFSPGKILMKSLVASLLENPPTPEPPLPLMYS